MTDQTTPEEFGITSELSTTNLLHAVSVYQELVKKLAGTATPLDQLKKVATDTILENDDHRSAAYVLTSQVRELVLGTLFRNPELSVFLADDMKDLLTDVRNLRDYTVLEVAKKSKVALPVDKSTEVLKDAAAEIRNFIATAYSFLSERTSKWDGKTPKELKKELEKVPTKKGKKGNLLDLPQVPGRKKSSENAGRGQNFRRAQYTVQTLDGELHNIPVGTHLRDVLIQFGSSAQHGVMTVPKFIDRLKRFDQDVHKFPWSNRLPNGITISGIDPGVEVEVDDDDDDETDDDDE